MESGTMSNSQRTMSGGATNTTGSGKGRSGPSGEGSNEPLMNIAATSGPTVQSKPVADPLMPHELGMLVQKVGQLVYGLNDITISLNRSLHNPSLRDDQKARILAVSQDLQPLAKKIFNIGMKLNGVFLPSKKKSV